MGLWRKTIAVAFLCLFAAALGHGLTGHDDEHTTAHPCLVCLFLTTVALAVSACCLGLANATARVVVSKSLLPRSLFRQRLLFLRGPPANQF